jgi:hypothetical protein
MVEFHCRGGEVLVIHVIEVIRVIFFICNNLIAKAGIMLLMTPNDF